MRVGHVSILVTTLLLTCKQSILWLNRMHIHSALKQAFSCRHARPIDSTHERTQVSESMTMVLLHSMLTTERLPSIRTSRKQTLIKQEKGNLVTNDCDPLKDLNELTRNPEPEKGTNVEVRDTIIPTDIKNRFCF